MAALKVAVVGLSGIGSRHCACYQQDPLASLVAVCDIAAEKADAVGSRLGVRAYHRLSDLLAAEPDLDLVDIATGGAENGSWHCAPVMEAIAAGRNVLVEKPLSNAIHEARAMVAAAEERGVYLACNLNHYFSPPAERARALIGDGSLGELRHCIMKMAFSGGEETYGGPSQDPRSAGLPYFHAKAFLTHPLSVMRHLCGDVTEVQAFFGRPWFRQRAGDVLLSQTSIHLRFSGGATGYLLSHRGDTPTGLGGWWSVEVGGTRGTIAIENCVERLTLWPARRPGGPAPVAEVYDSGLTDFEVTFGRRLHSLLEDIDARVPAHRLRGSGRDALAALEYTWAAIRSHERGGRLVRPHDAPAAR